MSVNIYNEETDKLEMVSGRVADAYTKTESDGLISGVYDNISDEWNPTKTYAVGDYAISDNQLWKAKVSSTNEKPTEGTYWTACKIGDALNGLSEIVGNIGEFKTVSSHGAVGNNQDYTVDISQYRYDTVGNFLIVSTNWSANPETIFTLVSYSAGTYFHVVDLARKGCVSVSGNVITIKNTSRYVVYRL